MMWVSVQNIKMHKKCSRTSNDGANKNTHTHTETIYERDEWQW